MNRILKTLGLFAVLALLAATASPASAPVPKTGNWLGKNTHLFTGIGSNEEIDLGDKLTFTLKRTQVGANPKFELVADTHLFYNPFLADDICGGDLYAFPVRFTATVVRGSNRFRFGITSTEATPYGKAYARASGRFTSRVRAKGTMSFDFPTENGVLCKSGNVRWKAHRIG